MSGWGIVEVLSQSLRHSLRRATSLYTREALASANIVLYRREPKCPLQLKLTLHQVLLVLFSKEKNEKNLSADPCEPSALAFG